MTGALDELIKIRAEGLRHDAAERDEEGQLVMVALVPKVDADGIPVMDEEGQMEISALRYMAVAAAKVAPARRRAPSRRPPALTA